MSKRLVHPVNDGNRCSDLQQTIIQISGILEKKGKEGSEELEGPGTPQEYGLQSQQTRIIVGSVYDEVFPSICCEYCWLIKTLSWACSEQSRDRRRKQN